MGRLAQQPTTATQPKVIEQRALPIAIALLCGALLARSVRGSLRTGEVGYEWGSGNYLFFGPITRQGAPVRYWLAITMLTAIASTAFVLAAAFAAGIGL